MDGNRFDSLARAIATWTSRRRFIGALAGAGAAGIAGSRRIQAQDQPIDPDVFAFIAQTAEAMNGRLIEFQSALATYAQSQGGIDPLAFDPRVPQFIQDLITLTENAKGAQTWDDVRARDFLLTLNLIIGGISAGADTDVYLGQYAIAKIGGDATPTLPSECYSDTRPGTCTATCLDVWQVRETRFLEAGQMVELIQAFQNFIECYIYFGSESVANGCLATLIDLSCIGKVVCACVGDCH